MRIRVTNNQFDRIKLNAQAKGFKTVSDYVRSLCLEHNSCIEKKIIENNEILKAIIKFLNSKGERIFLKT